MPGGDQDGWFDSMIQWEVGSGENITLWEDKWCGKECFQFRFARLYLNLK